MKRWIMIAICFLGFNARAADPYWRGVYVIYDSWTDLAENGSEAALVDVLRTRLGELKAANVNLIWVTWGPTSPDELGLLVRTGREYGIHVIAGGNWYLGPWNYAQPGIVDALVTQLVTLWRALPVESRPLAFSIADEPNGSFMSLFADYAKKASSFGIPLATVSYFPNFQSVAACCGSYLKFNVANTYAFFAPGQPGNPSGDTSLDFFRAKSQELYAATRVTAAVPMNMPQAFQTWEGPAEKLSNGYVRLLPGAAPLRLLPTKEQIVWQTWISIATGLKGAVFFAHGANTLEFAADPSAPSSASANVVRVPTNTGGPATLVSYPEFQKGSQFTAMSGVFSRIRSMESTLTALTYVSPLGIQAAKPGDWASLLENKTTGARYAVVIASPNYPRRLLKVTLPAKVLSLSVAAGDGELVRIK